MDNNKLELTIKISAEISGLDEIKEKLSSFLAGFKQSNFSNLDDFFNSGEVQNLVDKFAKQITFKNLSPDEID